ncbi:MAG: cysteine--tRNA ligase, partial [Bacteroidales bacterium]|nr:cysteine--tRNA ligase [Bacteroidales bacterium]
AEGTEGNMANMLEYGEFLTSTAPDQGTVKASNEIADIVENTYTALCDDLNTPIALSYIFEAVKIINTAKDKKTVLGKDDLQALVDLFDNVVSGVLGLKDEEGSGGKAAKTIDGLMGMVIEQRKAAKAAKDWATSDRIRDDLKAIGISIKDTKDGVEWTLD